jgi:hypothetical protein
MAIDVKTRFKSFLPGAGFDSSGNPKQGKTRVVGEIDVTSYDGAHGEPLKAVDIGLTTIDSISLRVGDEASADATGSTRTRGVVYSKTTGHFYLFADDADGAVAFVRTNYLVTATENLEFVAEGDGAGDVELT